jgi:hypothetical protein
MSMRRTIDVFGWCAAFFPRPYWGLAADRTILHTPVAAAGEERRQSGQILGLHYLEHILHFLLLLHLIGFHGISWILILDFVVLGAVTRNAEQF